MEFWRVADPIHSTIDATWDLRLILLSYLVACVASYTALDLADRVIKTRHPGIRRIWLASGAFAMGVGIWSMHFTGMLAFDMEMSVSYGWPLTLLSMLVAILAACFALFIVSRENFGRHNLLLGGSVMGVGIVSMHYIGMGAMRMPATLSYSPSLVGLSVLIAVAASLAALYLASRFSRGTVRASRLILFKLASGAIMGGAIVGMHYTGMWAAIFTPTGGSASEGASQVLLGTAIGVVTLIILGIALIASMVDRRFALQAEYLEASERRYESLFEHNPDAVFVMDLEGSFTSVNRSAVELFGYTEDELLRSRGKDFVVPESLEELRECFDSTVRGEPQNFEAAIFTKDGRRVQLNFTYTPMILEESIRGVYGIGKDVTKRKELETELERQATSDPLTALPNRTLFMDRMRQALGRASRSEYLLAVLFLDLDNFKYVNDSLGHEVGDRLLIEVSRRLRDSLRETDTAARIGGDEFAVLLEQLEDEAGAVRVARRISESLSEPIFIDGRELPASFSIGITLGGSGGEDREELLGDADTAMYRAKQKGKNRYEMFQPELKDEARTRLELENDLRYAIDNDQLTVHYQPKVWVEDGSINEVEALVRWERPGHGTVSPAEFIPVAEESGLIKPLGRQVLEEACRQTKAWQERYGWEELTICVNVSPQQFSDAVVVEDVSRALRSTGISPQAVTLEVTESMVMEDTESNMGTLQALKGLGIGISIDDFGKGYSSMTQLKGLPVDTLKIDRAFIDGLEHSSGSIAITNTIITLGRDLGLKVVAEGVETVEQLSNLQELGCDLAQGFYFSRPLPDPEMAGLLESRAPLGKDDVRRATKAYGYFAQAKRASEKAELLNRAVSASMEGVVITDHRGPDSPIIYLNEMFEKMTGYSAEDALGYNCRFLHGDDRAQPELYGLRDAIEAGREHTCVLRNYRKDGTLFWNELRVAPVYDGGGTLTNYIGVQNDVTELVREREELRKSESQLRTILLENATDVVLILDAEGTIRHTIPTLEPLLGHRPEGLIGTPVLGNVHPDDVHRLRKSLHGVLDHDGSLPPQEFRYRHANGSWRTLKTTARNLLDEPSVGGIVINVRDISHKPTPEGSGEAVPGAGLYARTRKP
ncbi:EAL domain-containing protein [Rubrobacter aplysinae]|uniref:EAL domain-containing protein n=1 Tax=Rubrobacter aplysinae TaxID=909625 RepID=UPI00069D0C47|nr:EAL domain-containing protein [Rubrobacter aplysinae]